MQLAKRYLEDLELPAPDMTCTQPKPFPSATARSAATGRAELRRLIHRERRAGVLRIPLLGR